MEELNSRLEDSCDNFIYSIFKMLLWSYQHQRIPANLLGSNLTQPYSDYVLVQTADNYFLSLSL